MPMLRMTDLNLRGKRVLMRLDLNVPIADGRVADDSRIVASLPSIRWAAEAGARVLLLSHLGRPEEGIHDPAFSLAPVAERLSELLATEVPLVECWIHHGIDAGEGEVVLCENVRFNAGEGANDDELARKMAALCDVYVMDAFGTAHRAQASTHGVARYAPAACAGPLLCAELEALAKALESPGRPMLAIVGGAKVSTKLAVLETLIGVVDRLIVGGGIANTFIKAAGYEVGKSLYEPTLVETAVRLAEAATGRGADIPVPTDVVVAKSLAADAQAVVKAVEDLADDDLILDVGPETAERLSEMVAGAATIVWNGPLGVFEHDQFGEGTRRIARAIADSDAFSIAGGGDTLAAIAKYRVGDAISYISTGGGAFLEFLEGKTLPAVAMLEERGASVCA